MKQNNFITIIIPTYNRPSYLKRILGYYHDCRIAHNIIVADGSSDEIRKANRETVSSFPVLKVLHLDGYSPETTLYDRINDALKHVNTKYCLFCADDDFITPNGINRSVDFLEANSDFAIAHGRYIGFYLRDEGKGESRFCWKTSYSLESFTSSDPAIRLNQHLSKYLIPTFYAVHKTQLLQMIFTEITRFTKDHIFSELLASTLALVYGKMKCLDVLYAARDASSTRVEYVPSIGDYEESGTFDEQYAKFRECLSSHLSKQSQLSLEEAEKVVDKAMIAYMKKYYTKKGFASLTTRSGKIMDRLNLPAWLDKGIRTVYRKLARTVYIEKGSEDLSPSSPYYEDINKIRQHVLSFSVTNA